ncbi:MAG: S1/P1 nuclease [Luteolibacter sp.]
MTVGLCFLCLSQRLSAWNPEGHMIMAQITYNHLDPTVKARCDELIATPLTFSDSGSSTFVTASVWADDYRSSLGTGTSHYIDLPISLDGTSTADFVAPTPDVVQAINLAISTLLSSTSTEAEQATQLRYLLHFVGDIQQPLHCTTGISASTPAGDAGGNQFRITGTWSNLHSLWDAGGGYLLDSLPRPLSVSKQALLNTRVATVESAHPYTRNTEAGLPNPMEWAIEGQQRALSICYSGISRSAAPTSTYVLTAKSTTEELLALGGHRLADLLNILLAVKPSPYLLPSGTFGFSWRSVSGFTYQIQSSSSLTAESWEKLTDVTATGSTASFEIPTSSDGRFFRLVK